MYALETMQLKGNNSSVLVKECFFVIPAHTLGIKEDGNDLSKIFFYLFKKKHNRYLLNFKKNEVEKKNSENRYQ